MKWTRGRPIGRGLTATVSTAVVHPGEDIVAVKSVDLTRWSLFQNEQMIHSTLQCPHIIEYKGQDVTFENGRPIYNILMEFASLGSLAEAIAKSSGDCSCLEEVTISLYSGSILKGLEYLHLNGIVHCDIKPSNVLVTADGGVKIADFGCARLVGECDVVGSNWPIAGTPIYMAPEVARGEQQGYPADVWALGCTVIEMATGHAPWTGASDPVSALYQIGFSERVPEIPEFLSDKGKDFLSKCLSKDPEQRWSAAQLLQHPFVAETKNPDPLTKSQPGRELVSGSPTSVLDTGLCHPKRDELCSARCDNLFKSPMERIRKLIEPGSGMKGLSGEPGWDPDDESCWVTVRSHIEKACFSDGVELESASFDLECFEQYCFTSYFGDDSYCTSVDTIGSVAMSSNCTSSVKGLWAQMLCNLKAMYMNSFFLLLKFAKQFILDVLALPDCLCRVERVSYVDMDH